MLMDCAKKSIQNSFPIEFIMTEFDSDSYLEKISTSEIVSLFASLAPEYGTGEIDFCYDTATASVLMRIDGVKAKIAVSDPLKRDAWGPNGETNVITVLAIGDVSPSVVNGLNRSHPGVNFMSAMDR